MPNTLMNDKPISTHGTPAVHLSLQGKGGVGKSLIASFLAQYYKDHGVNAVCVDTDPVNHTFAQYTALGAKHLSLMEGNQIDRRRFDSLIDSILESGESFIRQVAKWGLRYQSARLRAITQQHKAWMQTDAEHIRDQC